MNITNLAQLINRALTQSNNDNRATAENQLVSYQNANSTDFFLKCADIISSQNFPFEVRHRAGTVASRLLGLINANTAKFNWDEVHLQSKEMFKNKILGVLISPSIDIMRAGAAIIACIAAIQLPRGDWQVIIDNLAQNCTSQSLPIKLASITTLGFICQQIKNSGKKINDRLSEQILGAIIYGTRQNNIQIVKTSIKALQDSLCFLQSLMVHQKYRDAVFEVFTVNFTKNQYTEETYVALFEFAKAACNYLSNYRKALIDLTEAHLQRRKDQQAILNLELWETIGTYYADKMISQKNRIVDFKHQDNFLQSVAEQLLPMIMKCLLILNKAEQQEVDLRNSAIRAIEAFTQVCDKRVVDMIATAVGKIINSEDPYHQQATVPLFSTICQYSDRNFSVELFVNGFDHLFALLSNNNKLVVKYTLGGFVRLAQVFPEVMLLHKNVSDIVQSLFNFVNVQFEQIRSFAVQILANMSEGLKQFPQPVSDDPSILLTKVVKYYTQNVQRLHVNNHRQVNQKLTAIIMNIVMNTNKRDVIVQLIEFMIDEYYNFVNRNTIPDLDIILEQTLSVLHTAILAHKNSVPSNQLLGKICNLVNDHLKKFNVQTEGLSLLGAIATTFNKSFQARANGYMGFVWHGLQKTDQMSTFKAALACVGDFARMMQGSFFNNACRIMQRLLQFIRSNLDRDLKLCIINCMGDLVLSMQNFGQQFIDSILNISDICFQAVYELSNSEKDADYVDDLKSTVIEMYSCCVFSINSTTPNKKLFEHFGNLATFIVRTCNKEVRPTMDYLRNCIFLLFDSAAFYSNNSQYRDKVNEIIESNEVKTLVVLVNQFSDRPEIKELLDFVHQRSKF